MSRKKKSLREEYDRKDERSWAMLHFRGKTWQRAYHYVDIELASKFSLRTIELMHEILFDKLAFPLQHAKIRKIAQERGNDELVGFTLREISELQHWLKVLRYRHAQLHAANIVGFERRVNKPGESRYAVFAE